MGGGASTLSAEEIAPTLAKSPLAVDIEADKLAEIAPLFTRVAVAKGDEGAPQGICLSGKTARMLNDAFRAADQSKISSTIFEKAQEEIRKQIKREHFIRFTQSQHFKDLLVEVGAY